MGQSFGTGLFKEDNMPILELKMDERHFKDLKKAFKGTKDRFVCFSTDNSHSMNIWPVGIICLKPKNPGQETFSQKSRKLKVKKRDPKKRWIMSEEEIRRRHKENK